MNAMKIDANDVLAAATKIQETTAKIAEQDTMLEDICQKIQESQKNCDFVAIQLIRRDENVIETVTGTRWSGIAKHYLEADPRLRDIQADIVKTRNMEIIAGWDERFDEWIYEEYDHFKLARIFMPIIVFKNVKGELYEQDWSDIFNWDYPQDWEALVDFNWYREKKERNSRIEAQRTICTLKQLPPDVELEVIGTVEVAYSDLKEPIHPSKAIKLAQDFFKKAVDIYKTQLPWVLETIANQTSKIVKGESVRLCFRQKPTPQDAKYLDYDLEVFAGEFGKEFIQACPPRPDGIGNKAIETKKPQFTYPGEELFHPNAKEEKIKAIAAAPLLINNQKEKGVLYVHFLEELKFKKEEIKGWLSVFAKIATNAILSATMYEQMRDKTRQLRALNLVTQSFSNVRNKKDLLRHIAWNTLNILSADLVTIYEYQNEPRVFLPQPTVAGKLWREKDMVKEEKMERDKVPYRLVKYGEKYGRGVYVEKLNSDQLHSSQEKIFESSEFSKRERIKSVVGVILRQEISVESRDVTQMLASFLSRYPGQDISLSSPSRNRVSAELPSDWEEQLYRLDNDSLSFPKTVIGVMFINYRRHHLFSNNEEKQMIDILATSAAIALKRLDWSDDKIKVLLSDDMSEKLEEIRVKRNLNSLSQALGEAIGTQSFLINEITKPGQKLWLQKGDTYTELTIKGE